MINGKQEKRTQKISFYAPLMFSLYTKNRYIEMLAVTHHVKQVTKDRKNLWIRGFNTMLHIKNLQEKQIHIGIIRSLQSKFLQLSPIFILIHIGRASPTKRALTFGQVVKCASALVFLFSFLSGTKKQ